LNSISLNSKIAIRKFLIAPILLELLAKYHFKLKSEKSIYFDERLRGVLDKLIEDREKRLSLFCLIF
jgi:hypothetical protein